ncbi:DEAD/DEAH box helicase [Psychrobacter arenosus]|uniref:DEAD/DEAH box helicase n=1 Tax=Psychrobacter arenosus TaxID=256326 RepID=UPI00191B68EA|nr:DEAD/DEAH box helicase [Psychrobacter arenosus]
MNVDFADLESALISGFIDHSKVSKHTFKPEILVNDGHGKKVLTSVTRHLNDCDDFWFSVAFVTTSGTACLKQQLIDLENKQVPGRILVSQYLNFTQPQALRELLKFKNLDLRIAPIKSNFHAKGYLFNTASLQHLIIGSSNLTSAALTSNTEWNLKVSSSAFGALSQQANQQFAQEFDAAEPVTPAFIEDYEVRYQKARVFRKALLQEDSQANDTEIEPNKMQQEALENLQKLRAEGKNKALLISATGTGKTYLSAFDALSQKPKRLLYIVHRANIAKKALKTFRTIFNNDKTFGLYSGPDTDSTSDYIFSTVQTLSRDAHLANFAADDFDYIIIDETHRASAASYQKILNHFNPKFLLGMTATPERTDAADVFEIFDHNIAYEIRLQKALEMDILAPFHYYGISDLTINGETVEDTTSLNLLIREERIKHILHNIERYSCDNGEVRGLVFCSHIEECEALASAFNKHGLRSIALTGKHSEQQRDDAIAQLESNDPAIKLDYIFTVGIFNEGIDIPCVNQVVMLRPTESAIIFVQQLGRGLRKAEGKDYLTVIDFIGNYKNNFMVPIALYGDESYNKDRLRRLLSGESNTIPGTSTVNFDRIAKERIFKAINDANLQTKRDLDKDYNLLKYKLGYAPLMMDFIRYGDRDPFSYVEYANSFYHFAKQHEKDTIADLSDDELKLIATFSKEINNCKRVEESLVLDTLLTHQTLTVNELNSITQDKYGYEITPETLFSVVNNLNLRFITKKHEKTLKPLGEIYGFNVMQLHDDTFSWHPDFSKYLANKTFVKFLADSTHYAIHQYDQAFKKADFIDGFQLYRKYSRKDVFRILNWSSNPVAQNVGGYIVSKNSTNCPIFVNYHKSENITDTTKYEDEFVNESLFNWMFKSNRTLNSPEVKLFQAYPDNLRIPLFIKKDNDEGKDFYYMGDVSPRPDSFELTSISGLSTVKVQLNMHSEVRSDIYNYLLQDSDS